MEVTPSMKNPYTLVFGKEPREIISRLSDSARIIEDFTDNDPSQVIYMISGVRGTGKTVFMNDIANRLRKDPDWIVVELSSESDLLLDLVSELSSNNELSRKFHNAKINLSFWGFGLEIENTTPISNIKVALTKMLETLSKDGKRLLVTIDEVTSTKPMREFASVFQILIRQNLPIFLLMTGLFENIRELQDEKSLTFLYRAPRIDLKPLNIRSIADNYMENFHLTAEAARDMAEKTRGFSYAFQSLGYMTWENDGNYLSVLNDYRHNLSELVYEKIWSELSPKDKLVLRGMAENPEGKIKNIRQTLDLSTNEFNPYRDRLIKKGLINGDDYGIVRFTLPYFEEFVLEREQP